MDETKVMLEVQIEEVLKRLSGLDPNSEEYGNAMNDLNTLYKLKNEENKLYLTVEEQAKKREDETNLKKTELSIKKQETALKREELVIKREQMKTEIRLNDTNAEIQEKQLAEERKTRFVRIVVDGASILIPIMFYNRWMKKGFKFEETGTITSQTFKGLIRFFKPTRK